MALSMGQRPVCLIEDWVLVLCYLYKMHKSSVTEAVVEIR